MLCDNAFTLGGFFMMCMLNAGCFCLLQGRFKVTFLSHQVMDGEVQSLCLLKDKT